MSELSNMPCWYLVLTLLLALFHSVRGAIGQTYLNPAKEKLPKLWQKIVVVYVHDFLLHFSCTVFGSICLFIAFTVAGSGVSQLSTNVSLLIVFLALVGLAGITGQLAVLITLGKLPLPK